MTLNAFMHPRNIYKEPPDFKALAEDYPDMRRFMVTEISGKTRFDFDSPDALRVLTRTLLKKDFGLEVEIPEDKLVPRLPNRLNYILWVEDIVRALRLPDGETVAGLDIGTGPCAIYALLGALRGWRMVAVESDPESLETARRNVQTNQLQDKVQVLEADVTLLSGPLRALGPVHFTMCNPPFYDSEAAPQEVGAARCPPAGQTAEVSCPGGERAFVGRLIAESKQMADKCSVFTTMVGYKSSVRPLKKATYEAGAVEAITAELCQGKTKRWAIAWTFREGLALKDVGKLKQTKKRKPLECVVPRNMEGVEYTVEAVKQQVVKWLEELGLKVKAGKYNKYFASYKVVAMEDTWTHRRQARREEEWRRARERRQRAETAAAGSETSDLEPSPGSAELATSPEPAAAADLSGLSDASQLSEPALKRARSDSGGSEERAPDAKRACLAAELESVSLETGEQQELGGRRRPALVFTLFVQKRGYDILLTLMLLAGELDLDGMNAVLSCLRQRMRQSIVASETAASGGGGGPAGGGGAATEGSSVQRMGRVLGQVRDRMRQKISLGAPVATDSGTAGEQGDGAAQPTSDDAAGS